MKRGLFVFLMLFISVSGVGLSQNVAVSDDDAYTANASAMLDVKSTNKGFLAPRLTTAQRNTIGTPAAGLLVYDITVGGYYYYNGSVWINLSSGSSSGIFWSYTSPNIYMTTGTDKLGLGTSSPLHKIHLYESVAVTDGTDGNFIDIQNSYNTTGAMSGIRFQNGTSANTFKAGIFYQDGLSWGRGNLILANNTTGTSGNATAADARLVLQNDGRVMVKGDPNTNANTAIFAVQNADGDTIFAVYPEGVRIWVNDDGLSKATGSRGGFAVGGFSPSKAGFTNEYLRVTPDSVRVYIDDDYTYSKAAGSRGGFAVGGFSPSKGTNTEHYLFVQDDSTRVYVADSMEGFGVENIEGANDARIMRLTTENYFIGHESGIDATPGVPTATSGKYNSTLGYNTARNLTTGKNNIFFGYKSGYMTTSGTSNTFIGNMTGYNNMEGVCNVFIGERAGYDNDGYYGTPSVGSFNTYIGYYAAYDLVTGLNNVIIGNRAGWTKTAGDHNVMIGSSAGAGNSTGSRNVFLGYNAGTSENGSDKLYIENSNTTSPLIYGDFSLNLLGINSGVPTANLHVKQSGSGEEGIAIENDGNTNIWSWEIGTNDLNFYFNGAMVGYWDDADGSYNATSDQRLKKDVVNIDESILSKVMQLKPVYYRLNHNETETKKTIGFLAQEVLPLFPELVKQNEEGFYSLHYADFGVIAIKVIQEQQIEIEELKKKVEEIDTLKAELELLKKMLIKNSDN